MLKINNNIQFKDLKIDDHFFPKYNCHLWTLKAILESYGLKNGDIVLGKNYRFYYMYDQGVVAANYLSLREDLKINNSIELFEKKANNHEEAINSFIELIKKGISIYIYASPYAMPSHNKFNEKDAQGNFIYKENRLSEIIEYAQNDSGSHSMIISGWDEENDLFFISDLFHSEQNPFKGWVSREMLIEAIDVLASPATKNKWLDIKYEKNSFNFTEDIFKEALERNTKNMLSDYDNGKIAVGINGMLKLKNEISEWELLTNEEISIKEDVLFNCFYDIIMQREAHVGYLRAAEHEFGYDFNNSIGLIKENYNLYCKIRNLLFKGSRTEPKIVIERVSNYFTQVINNEYEVIDRINDTVTL